MVHQGQFHEEKSRILSWNVTGGANDVEKKKKDYQDFHQVPEGGFGMYSGDQTSRDDNRAGESLGAGRFVDWRALNSRG